MSPAFGRTSYQMRVSPIPMHVHRDKTPSATRTLLFLGRAFVPQKKCFFYLLIKNLYLSPLRQPSPPGYSFRTREHSYVTIVHPDTLVSGPKE